MGYKVISCRRGRQTMRLPFEDGFYSRAAFVGEFTVYIYIYIYIYMKESGR